jgi:hypothetical protein
MNRKNALNGLHFYNHGVVHHEVDSVRDADLDAFVREGERLLQLDFAAGTCEFVNETGLVGTLEQAGSQSPMNLESGRENTARDTSMKKFAISAAGVHPRTIGRRSVEFWGCSQAEGQR